MTIPTHKLSSFQQWALSIAVPRLGWPALDAPSENELLARAAELNAATHRSLTDQQLCQLLVHAGCLDFIDRDFCS